MDENSGKVSMLMGIKGLVCGERDGLEYAQLGRRGL
jgi:hypothetical protein